MAGNIVSVLLINVDIILENNKITKHQKLKGMPNIKVIHNDTFPFYSQL